MLTARDNFGPSSNGNHGVNLKEGINMYRLPPIPMGVDSANTGSDSRFGEYSGAENSEKVRSLATLIRSCNTYSPIQHTDVIDIKVSRQIDERVDINDTENIGTKGRSILPIWALVLNSMLKHLLYMYSDMCTFISIQTLYWLASPSDRGVC